MKEFKFICPSCQQKIEVEIAASGRQFACPGCRSELIVPAPPKQPDQLPAAILAQVKKRPRTATPSRNAGSTSRMTPPTSETRPVPRLQAKQPLSTTALQPRPDIRAAAEPAESPPQTDGLITAGKKEASIETAGPKQADGAEPLRLEPVQTTVAVPTRPDSPSPADEAASGRIGLVATAEEKPGVTAPADPTPSGPTAPQEKTVQIASLTPAIKRDMVRSIRRRIADEAHWMPGVTHEGKHAYAAKEVEGKPVSVEATDPEATRFSTLGASLAELHLRNVTRTASGRVEFLDQELLEAIRQAAGEAVAEREAGSGQASTSDRPAPLISHAQSLKALDLLEQRYTREIEHSAGAVRARPEDLRLAHLTGKLERKETVAVEEVCAALWNELKEINERLTALEHSAGQDG